MTNFATYLDSTNDRAPIAQRGKAKQKRSDLRLVGLGLVVTRDGGVPLVSHAYAGNRPDVTQFTTMIDLLVARHAELAGAATRSIATATAAPAQMTVVFDAGQNSHDNFAHLTRTRLAFVGSVPPSDCADLLALPATDRRIVDKRRFDELTALDTRRVVYGTDRRVILTHSPTLHQGQSRGFDQTLTKAETKLAELADTLARGKTRRGRAKVTTEIEHIIKDPWLKRVIDWELTGHTPPQHRLTHTIDADARAALEQDVFGKRVLVTDRDDWPVAEIVAAYRSQSEAEFGFRCPVTRKSAC
jgi:transposase